MTFCHCIVGFCYIVHVFSLLMVSVWQEMEATVVDGNGTETGHIIVTTIGGRNGQPKQVDM